MGNDKWNVVHSSHTSYECGHPCASIPCREQDYNGCDVWLSKSNNRLLSKSLLNSKWWYRNSSQCAWKSQKLTGSFRLQLWTDFVISRFRIPSYSVHNLRLASDLNYSAFHRVPMLQTCQSLAAKLVLVELDYQTCTWIGTWTRLFTRIPVLIRETGED